MTSLAPAAVLVWLAACGAAAAQTAEPEGDGAALSFTLGAGVAVEPDYFGSDDYGGGSPTLSVSPQYLRLPGGRSFGSPGPEMADRGLGLRGSLRYIGEREADDELAGLDDVDPTFEIGGGIGYRRQNFQAFADLRYGLGGHESFVGELGADLVTRPTDRLRLTLGPRLLLAEEGYTDTYFGIDGDAAEASGLEAYSPDGGVVSTGIELGARYRINDRWGVEGSVSYDRLTGDAADSPIVEEGSRDQYRAEIGVTRRFSLGF